MGNDFLRDFQPVETERLIIRKYREEDAPDVFEYAQNSEVTKYLSWYPHTSEYESLEHIQKMISGYENGEPSGYGIELKWEKKIIGSIGISTLSYDHKKAEIGFVISSKYWGMGFAAEAIVKFIDIGFSKLNLNRIEAHCDVENINSTKVLLKSGMKYEGTIREGIFMKEKFITMNLYSVLSKDWGKK